MWIAYKVKSGDTLQSIVKQHKVKDPEVILRYAGNKKVAPLLKKKQELKKGTSVWVPDPRATVYVIPGKKGKVVVDEKGYKEYLDNVHRTMDRLHGRISSNMTYATGRHDAQRKINDDQWFVSSIVSAFSSADEPVSQRKKAEATFSKFTAATTGRKYKEFEKLVITAEKEVNAYRKAVGQWVDGLIGTAETSVDVLQGVRDAGAFCGTAAAIAITAPASLPAAILVGGAASGGVNMAYDGYEQIGRTIAGVKPMSEREIGERFVKNAATGAVGAAVAGGIMKLIGGPLVKAIMSNKCVTQQVTRISQRAFMNRIFQAEIQGVANQLAKRGSSVSVEQFIKLLSHDQIMVQTLTKFLSRLGSGVIMKQVNGNKDVAAQINSWMSSNPDKLKGKDGTKIATEAAKDLANTKAVDTIYDNVLKSTEADLKKTIQKELFDQAEKMLQQPA